MYLYDMRKNEDTLLYTYVEYNTVQTRQFPCHAHAQAYFSMQNSVPNDDTIRYRI